LFPLSAADDRKAVCGTETELADGSQNKVLEVEGNLEAEGDLQLMCGCPGLVGEKRRPQDLDVAEEEAGAAGEGNGNLFEAGDGEAEGLEGVSYTGEGEEGSPLVCFGLAGETGATSSIGDDAAFGDRAGVEADGGVEIEGGGTLTLGQGAGKGGGGDGETRARDGDREGFLDVGLSKGPAEEGGAELQRGEGRRIFGACSPEGEG